MGLFSFLFGSKNKEEIAYSSEVMVQLAKKWTEDFYFQLPNYNLQRMIRMKFSCIVVGLPLDYGKNYGYLNKNSKLDYFFEKYVKPLGIRENITKLTWNSSCSE